MTDWSRLTGYIIDFFPDPSYSFQDIRDWAMKSVPAWKYMSDADKNGILLDWANFVIPKAPRLEPRIEPAKPFAEPKVAPKIEPKGIKAVFQKIKNFFKRLF